MGIAYNPKTATSGLILNLDSVNAKSAKGRSSNVLSWNDWITDTADEISSTGSWPGYFRNGEVGINTRITDTNPFSAQDIVWDVSNQDATSDDDGGWNTTEFAIDPTQTYRFSVWMRRKTIGDGSFYLGPHSNWGEVPGQYILNRSNSAENLNPYFVATAWPGTANQWLLIVGHVWAAGSGSGAVHIDSGIYNTSGTKIATVTDYMWAPTNTTSFHRCYLYYSTNTATNQQMYQPRVDICNGNEPSISDLLNNVGNRLLDTSPNRYTGTIYNNTTYSNNALVFNGTNSYVGLTSPSSRWNWTPGNLTNSNEYSFEMWVNSSDTSGQYFSKPWNGNGEYNYQASHNSWFTSVGNQSHAQSFTSLATGTWQHAVFIVNATQKAVYRNGILNAAFTNHSITNVTPTTANGNEELAIMTLYPYGQSGWNQPTHAISGRLGLFKVYNKVLTAEEVFQNFQATRGRFGV